MNIIKEILIDELEQNIHIEKVEDVIFLALVQYLESSLENPSHGTLVAYSIRQRIKQAYGVSSDSYGANADKE